MFLSLLCSTRLHLFDQNKTLIMWNIITIKKNTTILIIAVIKAEFSASLLQSSFSHDPSEISLICRFAAQETFMIIVNVETFFLWKIHFSAFFHEYNK